MNASERKIEILAPAGSVDQLISAVNNGCDAVYLGLEAFNARMKAPNFSTENLAKWVNYCHLFGVKVFVTLNTSIKNDEYSSAVKMLEKIYLNNADGVIVTDLYLLKLAGSLPKPFEVVASTQLNVHDKYGAQYVKSLGTTTVVCSRECSYKEIAEIASTGIKTECFLHGALCVCQSGQCLFSAMVGGNSGNRGLCAQPCRKKYFANVNGVNGYLLSARDIHSLTTVNKLVESGANVFKIEGRNRRPEYAGVTSRIYRNLFDNGFCATEDDYARLSEMFNRGMSENKYLQGLNSDIIYSAAPNHLGVEVGIIKENGFVSDTYICKGDGLKVVDKRGAEVCGGIAISEGIGYIRAEFGEKVCDGMIVRRTSSVKLIDEFSSSVKKLDAELAFCAEAGKPVILTAQSGSVKVSLKSDFLVEKATKCPVDRTEIARQLQKSSETYFTISHIDIKADSIFIAKSQLNALRRRILDALQDALVQRYNSRFDNRRGVSLSVPVPSPKSGTSGCAVTCYDESELACAGDRVDCLIYKPQIIDRKAVAVAKKYGCYIDLPSYSDNAYVRRLMDGSDVGIVCHNVGHVQLAREMRLPFIVGSGLNVYNDFMSELLSDSAAFVYSYELTLKEISAFANQSGYIFVDGKIPLMKLVHCPYKVAYGCNCAECKAAHKLKYTDELGNEFEFFRRRDTRCTFELINGKKLSVVSKLAKSGRYLLDFDERILSHYTALNGGTLDSYVENSPYTKGRLFSKVN
ncbi:MAG: U32 family peptidase [Corallococcus sp.]|nr:U32 family peptidase [Corallococcus sp.]